MGQIQATSLISTGKMSPRKEIENKKCENGVILDGFHHLKLKKYIKNFHICMLFFQCLAMNITSSYMNCSSNLVYSQI
jgi:hypothetical protein